MSTLVSGGPSVAWAGGLHQPGDVPAASDFTSAPVPVLIGTPMAGATMTFVRGPWSPTPEAFVYQWYRGNAEIPGASTATYQLTQADIGSAVKVAVTGSREGYTSITRYSASTRTVTRAPAHVFGWGLDDVGQAEPPAGLTGVAAISAAAELGLALKTDGTVVAWGDPQQPQPPADLSGIIAISAGDRVWAALRADGTVVDGPAGLTDVAAVSAGMDHTLALRRDGTVVGWGSDDLGKATVPAGVTDAIAVSAGQEHSLVLRRDGTVVAWGGESAVRRVPAGLSGVVAIVAGDSHNLALRSNGTVVAWGDNTYKQCSVPKGLGGVVAIASGHRHSLAVTSAGKLVAWGDNSFYQSSVPGPLGEVRAAAAGTYFDIVLGTLVQKLTSTPTPKINDTTPKVDQLLTAKPGSWRPAPVMLSYQWYRGSTAIAGETSQTYKVQPADVGKKLKVTVTGSRDDYASISRTSKQTKKVARASLNPTPGPVIDDRTPTVDQTLTAVTGSWGPAPVGLTFQWYKVKSNGKASKISGATAATYAVRAGDAGSRLKVKVTGTKAGYTTKSKTSATTSKVVRAEFVTTPTPLVIVEGPPLVGKAVTVDPGTYVPAASSFTYQWYRGKAAISKATKATYALTSADVGMLVTVRVKAYRTGYVTSVGVSDPLGPVQAG